MRFNKDCEMVFVVAEKVFIDGEYDYRILGVFLDEKVAAELVVKRMQKRRNEWEDMLYHYPHTLFYDFHRHLYKDKIMPYEGAHSRYYLMRINSNNIDDVGAHGRFDYTCVKAPFLIYSDEALKDGDEVTVVYSEMKRHNTYDNPICEVDGVVMAGEETRSIIDEKIKNFKETFLITPEWKVDDNKSEYYVKSNPVEDNACYCKVKAERWKIDGTPREMLTERRNLSVSMLCRAFPELLWTVIYQRYANFIELCEPDTYYCVGSITGDVQDSLYQDYLVEVRKPDISTNFTERDNNVLYLKYIGLIPDKNHKELNINLLHFNFRDFMFYGNGDDLCGYNKSTHQFINVERGLCESEDGRWQVSVYQLDDENPFKERKRHYGDDQLIMRDFYKLL